MPLPREFLPVLPYEGKAYVITGPEALTFQQAAEKLSAVLGREIQYVDVPLSAAEDGMRKSGMPEWNVRAVSELLGYFASGAAATVTDTVPVCWDARRFPSNSLFRTIARRFYPERSNHEHNKCTFSIAAPSIAAGQQTTPSVFGS